MCIGSTGLQDNIAFRLPLAMERQAVEAKNLLFCTESVSNISGSAAKKPQSGAGRIIRQVEDNITSSRALRRRTPLGAQRCGMSICLTNNPSRSAQGQRQLCTLDGLPRHCDSINTTPARTSIASPCLRLSSAILPSSAAHNCASDTARLSLSNASAGCTKTGTL